MEALPREREAVMVVVADRTGCGRVGWKWWLFICFGGDEERRGEKKINKRK